LLQPELLLANLSLKSLLHLLGEQRNTKIFDNVNPTFSAWSYSFKRELFLLSCRMKDDLRQSLVHWLDNMSSSGYALCIFPLPPFPCTYFLYIQKIYCRGLPYSFPFKGKIA
jgi:hypothetical protein